MFDTLFSQGSDCDGARKTDIAAWWFLRVKDINYIFQMF